jgi:spore coat polysaccharide biosynthesis protein SpsF
MNINKNMVFIQSRMGSERLPGKSMMKICGKPMLQHIIERVNSVINLQSIAVLTSSEIEDDVIFEFCKRIGIKCFRGSKDNVLDRFYKAALEYNPYTMIRICGDNPLISPDIIKAIDMELRKNEHDFITGSSLPIGCSAEGFTFNTLEFIYNHAHRDHHREHIVTFIEEHKTEFKIKVLKSMLPLNQKNLRFTVDTKEDFLFISEIYDKLYKNGSIISIEDTLILMRINPNLADINKSVKQRNPFNENKIIK